MEGLPDKLTFNVEEVATILGVSRNTAYDLVRRGVIPSLAVGHRKLVARHALAEFLGMPSEAQAEKVSKGAAGPSPEDDRDEWTYVITVKRLRRGERVRVEAERPSYVR